MSLAVVKLNITDEIAKLEKEAAEKLGFIEGLKRAVEWIDYQTNEVESKQR